VRKDSALQAANCTLQYGKHVTRIIAAIPFLDQKIVDRMMNRPIEAEPGSSEQSTPTRTKNIVYAAAAWAFVFAAMSFYWALGGMIGAETLGTGIAELARARNPELIMITAVTGVLKAAAGAAVLALVHPWGRIFPRWLLRFGVWTAGIIFVLYSLANFVQHGSMALGLNDIAPMIGTQSAVLWHLLFWDPFWLLGGVLFILSTRRFGRG
jgi:hypothetical protein